MNWRGHAVLHALSAACRSAWLDNQQSKKEEPKRSVARRGRGSEIIARRGSQDSVVTVGGDGRPKLKGWSSFEGVFGRAPALLKTAPALALQMERLFLVELEPF